MEVSDYMNKPNYSIENAKLLTVEQARQRYQLSRNLLMKTAEECYAIRRFGRAVRIDYLVLDRAIEKS